MPPIAIRVAGRKDIPHLEDLWISCLKDQLQYDSGIKPSDPNIIYYQSLLKQYIPRGDVWVAEHQGQIEGMAMLAEEKTLFLSSVKIGLITDMFVRPQLRQRGVGRKLLQAIKQEARRRGYERVRLQVYPENNIALDLYLNEGFDTRLLTLEWSVDGSVK